MRRKPTDPMMESNVRRESAIPVQGRISLVELAKLCRFWEEVEHVNINSMGKLLSWSISALCNLLENNEKIPEGIDSVASAHRYLTKKNLYQDSLKKRSERKISTAIRFESLRNQGIDPRDYTPRDHNMVNNKHSVETYSGPDMRTNSVNIDDVEMAKKMIALNKQKKVVSNQLREGMSKEELDQYEEDRERKIKAKENAPLSDVKEMMRLQEERKEC